MAPIVKPQNPLALANLIVETCGSKKGQEDAKIGKRFFLSFLYLLALFASLNKEPELK
jgi:hypothetical protein